ncbi:MAG: hypothetical protein J0H06_15095 [Actinobacteria bacterium]|nr:hypothetical protein [Actinomycetota bacterium]
MKARRRKRPRGRDDQRAAPALVVAAHQRQHQQQQRGGEADDAAPVDAGDVRVTGLAQLPVGDRDRRDPDRHVDEEDRLPAEAVGEQAADQRPDRDRHADRGTVDAHRHAPFGAAGELLGDQREADREHDRAADSLQAAGEVEEGGVGRERAEQRGGGEDRQPADEDAAPAEAVGERARCQHQRGERERVGVDHPLQVGEAAAEVLLDLRQRGVHDGYVEKKHEGGDADRAQRPPLPVGLAPGHSGTSFASGTIRKEALSGVLTKIVRGPYQVA